MSCAAEAPSGLRAGRLGDRFGERRRSTPPTDSSLAAATGIDRIIERNRASHPDVGRKPPRIVPMSQDPEHESFTKELGREIVSEAKSTIRFVALGSLIIGAIGAGAGLYYFGLIGLAIGSTLGVIAGGVIFFLALVDA